MGSWMHKVSAVNDCARHFNTKYTALIDIDMYFLSDPKELFETTAQISVPPMNYIHNFGAGSEQDEMWNKYYDFFKLERPVKKVETVIDKKMGNFYFTSSIIVFENSIEFREKYKDMYLKLYYSELPNCKKRTSQTILPIMITKYGWTWAPIPGHLCYMYHLHNYQLSGGENPPVIVHYCDNVIKEIGINDWNVG
jgi:hypothetical protein